MNVKWGDPKDEVATPLENISYRVTSNDCIQEPAVITKEEVAATNTCSFTY